MSNLGPFVVIAHQGEDVGHRELLVRRDRKRIGLRAGLRAVIVGREMLRRRRPAKDAPHPGVANPPRQAASAGNRLRRSGTACPTSDRTSPCSRRSFRRFREKRQLAGSLRGISPIRDLVGMARDLAVGHAHRRPDRPFAAGARCRRFPESTPLACRRSRSTRLRRRSRTRRPACVIT